MYNLSVFPVKGFKGDKLARLRGVLGLYENGKVIWNKWRKWNVLEDELLNFGQTAHDDAVDSMVLTMGGYSDEVIYKLTTMIIALICNSNG